MTEQTIHCRFRKNNLSLSKGVLRINAKHSDGAASYTLSLKEYFPFLFYNSRRFRFRSLVRWGGLLLSLVMIVLAIVFDDLGWDAVQYCTIPLMIFGFGCFIGSLIENGILLAGRPPFALWMIMRGEDGGVDDFPAPIRLSSEQEGFLAELEKQLGEYSRQEGIFQSVTCVWNPDAFDILRRLYDEGVLSPEEFAGLKRERIERIIPVPE